MEQNSFNKLVGYIQDYVNSNLQLKSFGVGFRFDLNKSVTENTNFPILYMEPVSHQHLTNTQTYTIRFYCLDIKQKDSSNEIEVISDTLQILNDLVKFIKNDDKYDVTNTPISIPVTNYTTEYMSGWFIDIDIQTLIVEGDCDIPKIIL